MAVDDIPSLMVDNALGTEIAVLHLVDEHGCRRIAYISGPTNNEEALLRAGGYRRALAARSITYDERLFMSGAFTVGSGRAAIRELLERGVDFDAIVAAADLSKFQFSRVAVSLFDDAQRSTMRLFFWMEDGREVEVPPVSFPAHLLAPPGFLSGDERWSVITFPIAFGGVEKFGLAVVDGQPHEMIYDALRLQLGSAMKAATLHREVVRQVELRERLEQEKVREESRVAARIQTTLVPERLSVEGLELCATMKPAAEVGGDYYDVIATPDGGWLGIGDVAGHGLAAGLITLMIQSMVSVMASSPAAAGPRGIVCAVNRAVHKNVRDRLKRDEHATLLLMRYTRDGRVTFAGAHEDILVCSPRTRRCATIPTSGVFIGVLPEIDAMTRDAELVLEDGDVLVLYSDGVTEARNEHHEQFGLDRLCATVEAAQSAPVEVIRDRILGAVEDWCPSLDDDITILVARYRKPG
ncbi:PP2C family protein-serine/threonine phosphatase [Sorangium sp. So ce367]|uniref:PP2C family protein-serine/threonine phosphatase n=1 Tax=Sorangium sp. So ce367 TaxID=3133305 RepID=UPI003F6355A9